VHDDGLGDPSISLVGCAFEITDDTEVTTMGFMNSREWMALLEKTGGLRHITA
jgi:hypothetical protein